VFVEREARRPAKGGMGKELRRGLEVLMGPENERGKL